MPTVEATEDSDRDAFAFSGSCVPWTRGFWQPRVSTRGDLATQVPATKETTMTCDQTQPLLEAFADGELGWGTAWRVRRHLAACPACTSELAELQQLAAHVRAWRDVPAPTGLGERIAAALPSAPPASMPRRPALIRRAAVGLAGIAAAAAAFFWLTPGQPGRPTIALADVEQAMASVKTMSEIDDITDFDEDGKVVGHHVDQQWIRRDPPAIVKINLSKPSDPREPQYKYKQVLEDERGQMTIMPDGSYSFIDDSPENLKSIPSYIGWSVQTLFFMAKLDRNTGTQGLIQGEETHLNGQPALKFDRTWHTHIPTPEDLHTIIWLDPKTRRMLRTDGQVTTNGKLVSRESSTHFHYDETPPPGIFDIVPPPGAKIKDFRVHAHPNLPRP